MDVQTYRTGLVGGILWANLMNRGSGETGKRRESGERSPVLRFTDSPVLQIAAQLTIPVLRRRHLGKLLKHCIECGFRLKAGFFANGFQ